MPPTHANLPIWFQSSPDPEAGCNNLAGYLSGSDSLEEFHELQMQTLMRFMGVTDDLRDMVLKQHPEWESDYITAHMDLRDTVNWLRGDIHRKFWHKTSLDAAKQYTNRVALTFG